MRPTRALVTGGAGFIGSHLVDRLIDDGVEVTILDNLRTGKHEHVNAKATLHEVDIAAADLSTVFDRARPQVVFHLAAQASVTQSIADPREDARINVLGSLNVMEQCVRVGIDRFVLWSTGGALYGEPETMPCAEDHPIRPLSIYGVSKYAVEKYLPVMANVGGFPFTILRYANVYGPRQDPGGEAGVVAIFTKRMLEDRDVTIFGDGTDERDYVYVADAVEAGLLSLDQGSRNDVFNIGTGTGTSVITIFDHLAYATGFARRPIHAPRRPGEVRRIALDASKARAELGWTPAISLVEGIERTVRALRD
ncbi:MAG: NAD-dependent epimerase/dehydratase family protein [Chloroflexi bacterium]|nr:NAD-dependent epimerase/dehydratase family protein [Chloroflexota bacterium]